MEIIALSAANYAKLPAPAQFWTGRSRTSNFATSPHTIFLATRVNSDLKSSKDMLMKKHFAFAHSSYQIFIYYSVAKDRNPCYLVMLLLAKETNVLSESYKRDLQNLTR